MSVALITMVAVVATPLLLLVVDLCLPRKDRGPVAPPLTAIETGDLNQSIRPGDGMVYRPGTGR